MAKLCIYCGEREGVTDDHAPPKCFFPKPRPSNLITVPCCLECNREMGRDDERTRNILTSLEATENHDSIKNQLSRIRDRSYSRDEGSSNLYHIIDSIQLADVYSREGIYLNTKPTFNLDQVHMDRFIEKMTRALLYYENDIGYVVCCIEWRMSLSVEDLGLISSGLRSFIASAEVKKIGDGIFSYIGYYKHSTANSLWLLNFYNGIEFMSILREEIC